MSARLCLVQECLFVCVVEVLSSPWIYRFGGLGCCRRHSGEGRGYDILGMWGVGPRGFLRLFLASSLRL